MSEIKTSKGIYLYTPTSLYYGRKKIDIDIAKSNLLDAKRIFDQAQIKFYLSYGTLLGAVREGAFIEHDEDTDIVILDRYKEGVLSLLFLFRDSGFEVARYDGWLLSLIRRDDYIDIYFFRKSLFGYKLADHKIPSRFFRSSNKISFLGEQFDTFNNPEDFLRFAYGANWKTPIKNKPAESFSYFYYCKQFIKRMLPEIIVSSLKNILKMIKERQ